MSATIDPSFADGAGRNPPPQGDSEDRFARPGLFAALVFSHRSRAHTGFFALVVSIIAACFSAATAVAVIGRRPAGDFSGRCSVDPYPFPARPPRRSALRDGVPWRRVADGVPFSRQGENGRSRPHRLGIGSADSPRRKRPSRLAAVGRMLIPGHFLMPADHTGVPGRAPDAPQLHPAASDIH